MSCQLSLLLVLSAALAGSRSSLVNVAQPQPQEPPTAKQQLKNDDQRTVTVRVNPGTGAFEELSGDGTVRQVTFHGVNYVRKGAPYIADTLECGGGGTQPACPPPVPCLCQVARSFACATEGSRTHTAHRVALCAMQQRTLRMAAVRRRSARSFARKGRANRQQRVP